MVLLRVSLNFDLRGVRTLAVCRSTSSQSLACPSAPCFAVLLPVLRSFWDSINSESVCRGCSLTSTAHNLTLYGAPHRPYGGENMLFACCLCSFRAKEGNSRLLWAYDRPRHTPPPEWLVNLWTPCDGGAAGAHKCHKFARR